MKKEKLISLINLLDDPDPEIYDTVKSNLMDFGIDVIPELEKVWEEVINKTVHKRLEDIIHEIQFNNIKNLLELWVQSDSNDLLKGAFLIAKYQFPDIEFKEIEKEIEKIKNDAWLELRPNLTALEKIKILNHIIFDIHKYSGNISNYYSPRNSYINQVLELKKGNPILLSIVYASIANRMNIPVYGVNLPRNFILAYVDELASIKSFEDDLNESVLFYINPFNKGNVFGRKEIDFFIKQQKLETKKSYYLPCSNIEVIQRVVINLLFSYDKIGYTEKLSELKELLKILT